MSPLPKPKKPKSHSNSDIALDDLKKYFPREWNKAKNVDDDDSGYEWGEDWKIEIVENEVVTGAIFSAQSKVLDSNDAINSNGIGTKIDVTTINRLFDIPYLVLIHYVHPKTGTSYVIWLDDWMAKQANLNWRTKENGTVTLRIPLLPENQLNSNKVEEIKQHVLLHSFHQGNDKLVDLINRTSKDYHIDVIKKKEGTTFIINGLHDEAIPHLMLVNDEAIQSGEKMIDIGLPTPISGEVAFSNIPPLLGQLMQNLKMTGLVASKLVENTRPFILSLEILDTERKSLYKIVQISMQMKQQGRKIIKWKGTSQVDGVILSFDVDPESPKQFNLQFDMTQDNDTPVIALNRMKFIQALQQGTFIELRELTLGLPFGESPIKNLQINIPEAIPSSEIELAETLVEIWYRLKIMIELPEKYNNRDITMARLIREILKSGRINSLKYFSDPSSGTGQLLMAPQLVPELISEFEENWKKGEENTIFKTINTPIFNLFGHKITLGKRAIVLRVLSVNKKRDQIIRPDTGEEAMEVTFTFDPIKSFTVYEDWCSLDDKNTYFPTIKN